MKKNMKNKKRDRKPGEPIVIEFNLSKAVLITAAIIILIVTVTTAKVVTIIIQAEESKRFTNEETINNEKITYVNSTIKDEEGNIVNETDASGNIIQIPVPKGYTASQIDGETSVSRGFVIYEGDVDWNTILVGEDTNNSADNTNTETLSKINTSTEKVEKQPIVQTKDEENIEQEDKIELTEIESDTTDETETTPTQQEINIFNLQKSKNQYVWVPVNDPSRIYGIDNNGKIWGKLYSFSSSGRSRYNWTENNGIMSITNRTGDRREPDVVWSTGSYAYDTDGFSYMHNYGIGETRYEMLAQELEQNYYEIISSIKQYGGFYIGRYQTGGLNGTAVVRKMDTNIASQNWYTMYKRCLTLKGDKDNIKTSIILGSLWDETIDWLVTSGATISDGTALTYQLVSSNSGTWGNYNNVTFKYIAANAETPVTTETKAINTSTRIPTGSADYTKANNIYDMAGNVWEWTTEANSTNSRVYRGGSYSNNSYHSATDRNYNYPNNNNVYNRLSCSTLDKVIAA